jgi:hypothetical protein
LPEQGAWIAYTSMWGNAWFGRSLTPDPTAGEIYSNLSVAAEIMACLIPTAIRFYWQNGEPWTAMRGWLLMAVALVVVFFAAGGFALTNINSGIEVRAERETSDVTLARREADTLTRSREDECRRRGDRFRELEKREQEAPVDLQARQAEVRSGADPAGVRPWGQFDNPPSDPGGLHGGALPVLRVVHFVRCRADLDSIETCLVKEGRSSEASTRRRRQFFDWILSFLRVLR